MLKFIMLPFTILAFILNFVFKSMLWLLIILVIIAVFVWLLPTFGLALGIASL